VDLRLHNIYYTNKGEIIMKKLFIILMVLLSTSLFAQNTFDVSYSANTKSYSMIHTIDWAIIDVKATLYMDIDTDCTHNYQIIAGGVGYSPSIRNGKVFIIVGVSKLIQYKNKIETTHPYICGGVMLNVAKDLNVMISYEYIGIFDASLGIGFNF
jgi:hypothetical protein